MSQPIHHRPLLPMPPLMPANGAPNARVPVPINSLNHPKSIAPNPRTNPNPIPNKVIQSPVINPSPIERDCADSLRYLTKVQSQRADDTVDILTALANSTKTGLRARRRPSNRQDSPTPPKKVIHPSKKREREDNLSGCSCHQCKSRRTTCRKKYCEHCLKKFYNESISYVSNPSRWICPSCRHTCCCAACRRRDGREEEQSLPPPKKVKHNTHVKKIERVASPTPLSLPPSLQPIENKKNSNDITESMLDSPIISPDISPSLSPLNINSIKGSLTNSRPIKPNINFSVISSVLLTRSHSAFSTLLNIASLPLVHKHIVSVMESTELTELQKVNSITQLLKSALLKSVTNSPSITSFSQPSQLHFQNPAIMHSDAKASPASLIPFHPSTFPVPYSLPSTALTAPSPLFASLSSPCLTSSSITISPSIHSVNSDISTLPPLIH